MRKRIVKGNEQEKDNDNCGAGGFYGHRHCLCAE